MARFCNSEPIRHLHLPNTGEHVCWNSTHTHLWCGTLPGVSLHLQRSCTTIAWEDPALTGSGLRVLPPEIERPTSFPPYPLCLAPPLDSPFAFLVGPRLVPMTTQSWQPRPVPPSWDPASLQE